MTYYCRHSAEELCFVSRKSVADRYFDLYQEDKVNGLHLVAFWYGDIDETGDSDTFMQSVADDRHGQLFTLENSSGKDILQETIDSCTWSKQYPEGFFAHLQSKLPDIRVISGIRERTQIFAPGGKRLQTWEEWGWNIIRMDDEAKANKMSVWVSGKKIKNILTEQQRTELEKRLKHYHGDERN